MVLTEGDAQPKAPMKCPGRLYFKRCHDDNGLSDPDFLRESSLSSLLSVVSGGLTKSASFHPGLFWQVMVMLP